MAAVERAVWPLMGLEVVTPMLTLLYIIDDLGVELALLAAEGVHDPATMPFGVAWTDELAVVLFIWLVFWTGAFVLSIREHVAFDVVYDLLPPRLRNNPRPHRKP